MTDEEQKALALVNEEPAYNCCHLGEVSSQLAVKALCRAIEQHEAFRQEVSDAVEYLKALYPTMPTSYDRFIIAKPVDPLVGVCDKAPYLCSSKDLAAHIRAELDRLGYEIREKAGD